MNIVGQQLFLDLFKVEPNVLKYFQAFREVPLKNLLQSRSFQNHGVRIMNLVKFAVENLDNPDKYRIRLVCCPTKKYIFASGCKITCLFWAAFMSKKALIADFWS